MTITKQDITNKYNTFFSTNKTYDKLSKEEIQLIAQILSAENTGGGGSVSGSIKIIDSDNDELKITSNGKLDINSITTIPLASNAATESTLSTLNNKFSTATGRLLIDGSQVTQPVSLSSLPTLPSGNNVIGNIGNTGFNINNFPATQPVSIASLPVLPTGTNTIGSIANTTFNSTQSGIWNINNISGTISLPTGASTSALQTAGNTSLSSIDSKTPGYGTAGSSNTNVLSVQGISNGTSVNIYNIGTNIFGTTITSTFSASTTSATFTISQKFAAAIIPVISGAPTITVQVTLDSGTTWVDTSVQIVSSASVPTIIECDSFARLTAFTAVSNAFRFKSSSSITATISIRYTHA